MLTFHGVRRLTDRELGRPTVLARWLAEILPALEFMECMGVHPGCDEPSDLTRHGGKSHHDSVRILHKITTIGITRIIHISFTNYSNHCWWKLRGSRPSWSSWSASLDRHLRTPGNLFQLVLSTDLPPLLARGLSCESVGRVPRHRSLSPSAVCLELLMISLVFPYCFIIFPYCCCISLLVHQKKLLLLVRISFLLAIARCSFALSQKRLY